MYLRYGVCFVFFSLEEFREEEEEKVVPTAGNCSFCFIVLHLRAASRVKAGLGQAGSSKFG